MLTALIAYGIKESLRVNLVLVGVKLFVVLFVIVAGHRFFINADNYHPFIPPAEPIEGAASGLHTPLLQLDHRLPAQTYGVARRSSSRPRWCSSPTSASTSSRPPPRRRRTRSATCPAASSARWSICTILYVAVALVITGMVNYKDINPNAALATAFIDVGQGRVRHADLRRCGRRPDHRGDDADDRRRARAVRDEPRQPAAASPSRT